jgi:hypothetical protein
MQAALLFLVTLRAAPTDTLNCTHFTQILDHFDSHNDTTFPQPYCANWAFSSSSPNFSVLYLGPGALSPVPASSSVSRLAQLARCPLYTLEHRFLNQSTPDSLPFLSVRQALEDIATFIDRVIRRESGRFVIVAGDGYFGSLASWFRLKYPLLCAFAWASSAPSVLVADFSDYDVQIRAHIANQSSECASRLTQYYQYFDANIKSEMFVTLNIPNGTNLTSALFVLADAVARAVASGRFDDDLSNSCGSLDLTPSADSFAVFFADVLGVIGVTAGDLDPLRPGPAMLPLEWLACTELGWFPTSGGFRPASVNLSYFSGVCRELFGVEIQTNNLEFGGPNPASSDVFFVNDVDSPWHSLFAQWSNPSRDHVLNWNSSYEFNFTNLTDATAGVDNVTDEIDAIYIRPMCDTRQWAGARCLCNLSNSGLDCTRSMHLQKNFQIVAVSAVLITSILLLIIGISVWICGGKPEDEGHGMQRQILYT